MLLSFVPIVIPAGLVSGCTQTSVSDADPSRRQFPLDTLPTASITIDGATIPVYLATTPPTREEGLMHLGDQDLGDDEGMLFVFESERVLSFWMRNTFIPLDIAYARADGEIVTIHEMPPQTLRSFLSTEPALFALEMKAGAFERLGIDVGDTITLADDVMRAAAADDE